MTEPQLLTKEDREWILSGNAVGMTTLHWVSRYEATVQALEAERGLDNPWPMYQNWPYGKVDAYKDFYMEPQELHASTAQRFEKRVWSPEAIAQERAK